jgi:hypothetical protein
MCAEVVHHFRHIRAQTVQYRSKRARTASRTLELGLRTGRFGVPPTLPRFDTVQSGRSEGYPGSGSRDLAIRRSGDPAIRRFGDLAIRRFGDIGRSGDVPKYTAQNPIRTAQKWSGSAQNRSKPVTSCEKVLTEFQECADLGKT